MKRWVISACMAVSVAVSPASFAGGEMTSATLVEDAALNYLTYSNFSIIGVCIWFQCSIYGLLDNADARTR